MNSRNDYNSDYLAHSIETSSSIFIPPTERLISCFVKGLIDYFLSHLKGDILILRDVEPCGISYVNILKGISGSSEKTPIVAQSNIVE